ncbi:MAG TPA: GatB/YqeY domain-containing protein [Bacteroidetes bacterium]|nr:GatB/YqeY domain-containing protein [Bacteroidota bacterium]
MNLMEQIGEDIKNAMKAKETEKLTSLRAIKAELLLLKTSGSGTNEISEEAAIKLLQKMVKQRKGAAEIYKQQGREDLYEIEMKEVSFIQPYLPEQLSDEQLSEELKKIIQETGATSIKDMGKIMGIASAKFQGKAESKKIAEIIKLLLNS